MTIEEILLEAIRAEPTDDTARLALADWLEENDRTDEATLARLHLRLRREPDLSPTAFNRMCRLLKNGVRPRHPEIVNSLGMRFVQIPPGVFWMGAHPEEDDNSADELPRHEVEITQPFYLAIHELTQSLYQRVTGRNPSSFVVGGDDDRRVKGRDTSQFPVEHVSWYDVIAYCRLLNELPEEMAAQRTYRLPTEAEWEYACRAGSVSWQVFHFGQSLSSRQANFNGQHPYGQGRRGPNLGRTTTVGSYPPNAWGLYDMHGNVWEWCHDWHGHNYYQVSPRCDPAGAESGNNKVLRGGSWCYSGRFIWRTAIRGVSGPRARSHFYGARLVCEVGASRRMVDDVELDLSDDENE